MAAKTLLVCPLPFEQKALVTALKKQGVAFKTTQVGPVRVFESSQFYCALSGLGKTQTALQTQFLLDRLPSVGELALIGSAGALDPNLKPGEVLLATQVIEWGFEAVPGQPAPKVFQAPPKTLIGERLVKNKSIELTFRKGPILCLEEAVRSSSRAEDLLIKSGAIAVSWEGAGLARVAGFNQLLWSELRAISDRPELPIDPSAGASRGIDLNKLKQFNELGMQKVAQLILNQG